MNQPHYNRPPRATGYTRSHDDTLPEFDANGNVRYHRANDGDIRYRVLLYMRSIHTIDELSRVCNMNRGFMVYLGRNLDHFMSEVRRMQHDTRSN